MSDITLDKEPVTDRLERIFFQLLDMLDRQTQERQLLIKEKEELGKLTQLLINQTKEIGQYEAGIRKRIQDTIKDSTQIAIKNIEVSVYEKSSESIQQAIDKINQVCESMESVIVECRGDKNYRSWWPIGVAIISGVLSSILTVWLLMPKPTLPLTSEQISYLQEGKMLVQVWPKLTNQEKNRLHAISYSTGKNH